ncbi:hypothetical protein C0993_005888, partial [Termitomyces sp. T159_Od127]
MQRTVYKQRHATIINAAPAPVLTRGAIAHSERMANLEARQQHIELNPEHMPLNQVRAQMILQNWKQQHAADLEEDFNGLGPQIKMPAQDNLEDNVLAQNNDWENNILAQDGLENICAAFAQMMQNLLECLKDPTSNGDNLGQGLADHDSAGHILEKLPLDPP